jgi:hypothetical protein
VEAKPRDVHVLGPPRYFQQLQDAHALPDMIGADPARPAGEEDLFKPFMSEATDRSFSVNCSVYSVNHRWRRSYAARSDTVGNKCRIKRV